MLLVIFKIVINGTTSSLYLTVTSKLKALKSALLCERMIMNTANSILHIYKV